eukprot:COSAG01_NODE_2743_length_7151_cov_1.870817_4_plen_68_part_00
MIFEYLDRVYQGDPAGLHRLHRAHHSPPVRVTCLASPSASDIECDLLDGMLLLQAQHYRRFGQNHGS